MFTDRSVNSRNEGNPELQVVVKLKSSTPTRRVFLAAANDGVEPKKAGALKKWLNSKKLSTYDSVFGDLPEKGLSGFRRLAIAATTEPEKKQDKDLAGINVLSLHSEKDAKRACKEIGSDPLVEYAYVPPRKYVLAKQAASDPLMNRQWGLNAIQLFLAEKASSFKPAKSVAIAVIDSGVDSSHPDLSGIFVEEKSFTTGSPRDTSGHGTHVSGIIAALTNNNKGIRGITNSTKILSLKALDPYSATGYYQAIKYATDNAQIINLSLGGGHDPTEELLIKKAISQGVVVVAAMGNEKQKGNPKSYPGAIKNVIAIGATNEVDGIAPFSNTGTHIDLVAPGVNILSTVPTYPSSLAATTDYDSWPGTSMAAPMVSACAALLIAKKPNATVTQIRNALVKGADKVPGQTGFNTTFGHGRLNVVGSLKRI